MSNVCSIEVHLRQRMARNTEILRTGWLQPGMSAPALMGVMVVLLSGCGVFPESSFVLSPESRLPRWFTPPTGTARSDLTVTMDYYAEPWGRTATFKLKSKDNRTLVSMTGAVRGSQPSHLGSAGTGSPAGYPLYQVVTVNGVVEVVEHRAMEPIFYVTDDAAVWKELGLRHQ